jgi:hypothetical protein
MKRYRENRALACWRIGRWRKRWAAKGLEGLKDAAGRGRKPPTIAAAAICSALSLAARQAPGGGTLERADDSAGNRLEQIERAAFVVGSRNRSASTQGFQTKDLP